MYVCTEIHVLSSPLDVVKARQFCQAMDPIKIPGMSWNPSCDERRCP